MAKAISKIYDRDRTEVSYIINHCLGSIVHICMDNNVIMKVQQEKMEPLARGEFMLCACCMTKCAVLNFPLKNPVHEMN